MATTNPKRPAWERVVEKRALGRGEYWRVPIGDIVKAGGGFAPTVAACCENPEIWLERAEASEITSYFRLGCSRCGRMGEQTDWSHGRAIALWNIALWNPKYMGRDGMNCADSIDEFVANVLPEERMSVKAGTRLAELLSLASKHLRGLTVDCEENRVNLNMHNPE